MPSHLDASKGDAPGKMSNSSGFSFGGHLEHKNSITSVEYEPSITSAHSSVEDEGPTVTPHMGLLSSCNMVNRSDPAFFFYILYILGGFSQLNFFFYRLLVSLSVVVFLLHPVPLH